MFVFVLVANLYILPVFIMLVIQILNVPLCVSVKLSAVSDKTVCQRNEKLDQKISLYSGDITKLEIDAIVNAGMCVGNERLCEWEMKAHSRCDALKL